MSNPLRVLVIDDSALMRKLIPQILAKDPSIEVVGTAMDGEFGLKKIEELRPQVVTLDLEMPRMDGMETLRQIMRRYKLPVIVVSAHSTSGASATFKALALGAFDFVAKPRDAASAHMDDIAMELIGKIKVAASSQPRVAPAASEHPRIVKPRKSAGNNQKPTKIIALGISTGGPIALEHLLTQLPYDFPGAFAIVQHMPEGFTEMFARRLDDCCAIEVKEAQSGDMLVAGRALICPGNKHLRVKRMALGDVVLLADDAPVNGHRPSVDVLFRSVAKEFGSGALGVLMTGMGEDGAEGLGVMKQAGALTIAQDEYSSVVYGMPKAAVEKNAAREILPLSEIAAAISSKIFTSQKK